jgi:hypothetical protein
MDAAVCRGEKRTLLFSQSVPAGTFDTDNYLLVGGGGLIVWVDITAIGSGILTDVRIQAKNGSSYDTLASFAALAINSGGRYGFRVAPGAARAAGANSYKGAVEDVPPSQGRIEIVTTTGAIVLSIKVENVG